MFTVITRATSRQLTTLDNLKLELDISGTAQDEKLQRLIDRASAAVCSYLRVPAANDGSVTLGLETIAETFWQSPWTGSRYNTLMLARMPVTEVVSVVAAGEPIDLDDIEIDGAAGILRRVRGSSLRAAECGRRRTVVTYKAGWTLPGTADFTLPLPIEGATIGLIRGARFAATRDPAVKSEWTTDIERVDYWVGQIGENGAFPPDIAATLDPFCYESVG
ncbi:phage head-tail connector protein [Rhodopseudomonas sp. BR0C11]|uniref:phage head-tail connector protein n=1 Tax=Rhodopseudomonas sp. BR0C11 TaxID=2269370 RepID=UPI0013E04381|nr:phage head-tail connector protein [Rhodopseudomonas sp. BR0C11]NEV75471.1 phage head-tail connector protein [Rhodopseudomonas sp. BR0C11]